MLQYSCLESPPPWQRSLAGHSPQGCKEFDTTKATLHADARFFCLWQLCPSEGWTWRWRSCLACRDPGSAKCAGTWTASATGVMALSESFSEPLVFGDQKASLASFSIAPPIQALRRVPLPGVLPCCSGHQSLQGAPWVGSYSVVQSIKCFMCQPLCCSGANAGMWRERGYGDGSTSYTWLSSITLLPWLPDFPP